MDDAISLEDVDGEVAEAPVAAPPTAADRRRRKGVGIGDDMRTRMIAFAQRGRGKAVAAVSGAQRLASLYFAQTGLIFPGRKTQGLDHARVESTPGAELVTLHTSCRETVSAMFGPATDASGDVLPDASARPTILFFYGNAGHLAHRNVVHLFESLRRIGVNVMIPEYIGYGMSTGDAGEAGCYATADAAYAHLRSRPDIDPAKIVACGASLGGAVAIDLVSRQRSIAGLITLITFTSMPDMAKVIQPTLPIWRFIKHKFESERKMPWVKCPTLIIHSTGDALVPYTMSDRLAAACGGPVTRVKIEGAGHSSVEMLEGGRGLIHEAIGKFLRKF